MAGIDLGSNANQVETDVLYIQDNSIRWSDTIIQISNIAMVSTSSIGSKPFPLFSILVSVIGIVVANFALFPGFLIMCAAAAWIVYWYMQSEKEKKMKMLKISLNSGVTYSIIFNDKKFLTEVLKKMADLISKPTSQRNYTINVKDSTFSGDSSVVKGLAE